MAIGSGLSAFAGFAAESTYGTYVAPTRFHEFTKEDFKKVKNVVQGGGLASGRPAQLGSKRVVSTIAAAGTLDMEVSNKGHGLLFSHLMGSSTITQQGATTAWLQSHTVGDNIGKSLSGQIGVPSTNGTVNPYSFTGGKILSAEFSCDVNGLLTVVYTFDFQNVVETQTLATASYTSTAPRHFGEMAVKLGTFGTEAAVTGVKKFTIKFERPQNTDRFYAQSAGAPGTKSEPVWNDYFKVTGSFDVDFVTKADFADRFASDSSTSCVVEFVGPTIASTYKETCRFKVPMIFFDTDTPVVGGADVVSGTFGFTGQYDGTNSLATIEYMSSDIAI